MNKLNSLTGLRAILAVLVLIVHSFYRVGWLDSSEGIRRMVGSFGHFGVVGFFVLSGLILCVVYNSRDWTVREFAVNRIARIYPLYLCGILIALPVDWLSPGFASEGKLGALGLTLVSMQSWFEFSNGRFNGPGWTLSVEAFFYAVFPLLFMLWKNNIKLFYILWGIILAATASVWDASEFYGSFRFPALRLWEFMLGMMAGGWLVKITKVPEKPWIYALALLASGPLIGPLIGWYINWDFVKWLWMAVAACGAILLLGAGDIYQVSSRPFSKAIWILAGEISYGVYLLHDPIQRYFKVAYSRISGQPLELASELIKLVYIFGTSILAIVAAYVFWRMVEIPARKHLRLILSKKEAKSH
jgi:peptidoglycan/LPS O-acetylase OafA/YrhL